MKPYIKSNIKSNMKSFNKNKFCNNCGNYGHFFNKCTEPKTSIGIIAVNFSDKLKKNKKYIEDKLELNIYDIDKFNYLHLKNIPKIKNYSRSLKFLMICRKHSFNYVGFLRGKYKNIDEAIKMLKLTTKSELEQIKTNDFDVLWKKLWKETADSGKFSKEYKKSKQKFEALMDEGREAIVKLTSNYDDPEWGFPKGRKNINETNMDCAVREFKEETLIETSTENIIKNILPIKENVLGTNQIDYRNIYYLTTNIKQEWSKKQLSYNNEVSKIQWMTLDEIIENLRPYYSEKINLAKKILLLFININEDKKVVEENNLMNFM